MASTEVQPADVADKVLRRAQVSKMTRALQNRLALANVKVKHGWENLNIDTIEPQIELELKRKRPGSSRGARSDTSSSLSDRFMPNGTLDSSPLAPPMFSDDPPHSGSSYGMRKRLRSSQNSYNLAYPGSSSHARQKVRGSRNSSSSWKSSYRLPESSPAYHTRHAHFAASHHSPELSFVSEATTVADRSPSLHSEEDDDDLPTLSFQQNTHNIHSSPPRIPRTPSPDIARSARLRSKPFPNGNVNHDGDDTGAGLLLFLAASPSPAVPNVKRTPRTIKPPSTPPPKSTPLPSSMMTTPGGANGNYMGFGASTPGMGFSFADYLNVTPSPAQAAWRTPAGVKSPLAGRDTRRRLNFDGLHPPTGESPSIGVDSKLTGLGMELGGELVSSQ